MTKIEGQGNHLVALSETGGHKLYFLIIWPVLYKSVQNVYLAERQHAVRRIFLLGFSYGGGESKVGLKDNLQTVRNFRHKLRR